MQAVAANAYQMLRNDPLVDPEALVRDVVHSLYRGESDRYISKATQGVMGAMGVPGNENANPNAPGMGRNMVEKSIAAGQPTKEMAMAL